MPSYVEYVILDYNLYIQEPDIKKVKMERSYACEVKPGKVLVKGWVDQIRDIGKLKFFRVRDRTGSVQVTLKKGEKSPAFFRRLTTC